MTPSILGISTDSNGLSAAVLVGDRIVSAVEQFKIREHWSLRETTLLPRDAISASLQIAQVDLTQIDTIAFTADVNSAEIISNIRSLGVHDRTEIEYVDRRQAHAAAAFYSSPFERAAILTLGSGNDHQICLGIGEGKRIVIEEPEHQSALRTLYGQIYRALGFHHRTANKVVWLGANGNPQFLGAFREATASQHALTQIQPLLRQATLERPQDVAASLQARTTEIVIHTARELCHRRNLANICVAGHLAENPLLIRDLEQHFGAHHVFVPPAPGMESLSIGAALAVKKVECPPAKDRFLYPSLGPQFSDSQIKTELDNCKLVSRFIPDTEVLVETISRTLAEGSLAGLFHGRCEFGHRALGFRSIVANPFTPYIDENINRFLKHRETFHPFVISVPEEATDAYFREVGMNGRTIASVYAVQDKQQALLSKFVIQNAHVRVHTVNSADNRLLWTLLHKMKTLTGHPLLINTSFNLPGEPLVMTPRDAIRSFYASGLDVLMIGHFVVTK